MKEDNGEREVARNVNVEVARNVNVALGMKSRGTSQVKIETIKALST